jgi:hypothetical protein
VADDAGYRVRARSTSDLVRLHRSLAQPGRCPRHRPVADGASNVVGPFVFFSRCLLFFVSWCEECEASGPLNRCGWAVQGKMVPRSWMSRQLIRTAGWGAHRRACSCRGDGADEGHLRCPDGLPGRASRDLLAPKNKGGGVRTWLWVIGPNGMYGSGMKRAAWIGRTREPFLSLTRSATFRRTRTRAAVEANATFSAIRTSLIGGLIGATTRFRAGENTYVDI